MYASVGDKTPDSVPREAHTGFSSEDEDDFLFASQHMDRLDALSERLVRDSGRNSKSNSGRNTAPPSELPASPSDIGCSSPSGLPAAHYADIGNSLEANITPTVIHCTVVNGTSEDAPIMLVPMALEPS